MTWIHLFLAGESCICAMESQGGLYAAEHVRMEDSDVELSQCALAVQFGPLCSAPAEATLTKREVACMRRVMLCYSMHP